MSAWVWLSVPVLEFVWQSVPVSRLLSERASELRLPWVGEPWLELMTATALWWPQAEVLRESLAPGSQRVRVLRVRVLRALVLRALVLPALAP